MGRDRWHFLSWLAFHWRWAWLHLVSQAERTQWVLIAAAMASRTMLRAQT